MTRKPSISRGLAGAEEYDASDAANHHARSTIGPSRVAYRTRQAVSSGETTGTTIALASQTVGSGVPLQPSKRIDPATAQLNSALDQGFAITRVWQRLSRPVVASISASRAPRSREGVTFVRPPFAYP